MKIICQRPAYTKTAKAFLMEDVDQMEITSEQDENANGNVKVRFVA